MNYAQFKKMLAQWYMELIPELCNIYPESDNI